MYRLYRVFVFRYVLVREVVQCDILGLSLLQTALYLAQGDVQDFRYLAEGFAVPLEPENVENLVQVVCRVVVIQVFLFLGIAVSLEVQEAVLLDEVVDNDIVAVVQELAGANFDLFQVPEVVVPGAASKCDAGIEETDQLGTSGKVV